MLPGALAERRENISQLHSCPTWCVGLPPPKPKYTNLARIHLRDTAFSGQEAVWVKIVWVHIKSHVPEHGPEGTCGETEYRATNAKAHQAEAITREPFGKIYPL